MEIEKQSIVASIIIDLNQKKLELLTQSLKWVSEDLYSREAFFEKAIELIKDEYPQTWEWLEVTLEKLKVWVSTP